MIPPFRDVASEFLLFLVFGYIKGPLEPDRRWIGFAQTAAQWGNNRIARSDELREVVEKLQSVPAADRNIMLSQIGVFLGQAHSLRVIPDKSELLGACISRFVNKVVLPGLECKPIDPMFLTKPTGHRAMSKIGMGDPHAGSDWRYVWANHRNLARSMIGVAEQLRVFADPPRPANLITHENVHMASPLSRRYQAPLTEKGRLWNEAARIAAGWREHDHFRSSVFAYILGRLNIAVELNQFSVVPPLIREFTEQTLDMRFLLDHKQFDAVITLFIQSVVCRGASGQPTNALFRYNPAGLFKAPPTAEGTDQERSQWSDLRRKHPDLANTMRKIAERFANPARAPRAIMRLNQKLFQPEQA